MSTVAQRIVSRVLVAYGAKLPYHPGKWRVVGAVMRSFGLDKAHREPVTVRRHGIWLTLDTRYYIDRWIYYLGSYESRDTRFMLRVVKSGWVVCDIGANLGWYALLAARAMAPTGRVYAFEPVEEEFVRFRRNVALNHFDNIVPHQLAMSDAQGEAWLTETRNAGTTRLATAHDGRHRRIPTTTLDTFARQVPLERLDLIKVDIEGAEARFLSGAHASLSRFRPIVMIELSPDNLGAFGSTVSDVRERLVGLGYRLYRSTNFGLAPLADLPAPGNFFNAIALPAEWGSTATLSWVDLEHALSRRGIERR